MWFAATVVKKRSVMDDVNWRLLGASPFLTRGTNLNASGWHRYSMVEFWYSGTGKEKIMERRSILKAAALAEANLHHTAPGALACNDGDFTHWQERPSA